MFLDEEITDCETQDHVICGVLTYLRVLCVSVVKFFMNNPGLLDHRRLLVKHPFFWDPPLTALLASRERRDPTPSNTLR